MLIARTFRILLQVDLIGEVTVDNIVDSLVLRLDVDFDSLDFAFDLALMLDFDLLSYNKSYMLPHSKPMLQSKQ